MMRWLRSEVARAPVAYAALLVAVVACFTYANTLDVGFHYDDSHHLVGNPYVRDMAYVPRYFTDPGTFSGNPRLRMYRPVLMTTYAWDYHLGGYRPLAWRLTAIALHALGAIGVLLAFRRLALLMRPGRKGPALAGALVAALVFAVHPVFSETVDYASARSSLLATVLLVWAFWLHHEAAALTRRGPRLLLWTLSLALFGGALLTKSIAVVYPFLLAGVALVRGKGWRGVAPAVALVALYLVARDLLLGTAVIDFHRPAAAGVDPYDGGRRPIPWNLFTQARVLLAYLWLLVCPTGLNVDHHVRISRTFWEPGVLAGTAALVGLVVAGWRMRKTRPLVALGIFWFLLALAPTSTLIPLNVVMNEHRLYLPGVGFALVAGAALWPLLRRRRWAVRGAFAATCLVLLALTLNRNEDWRDPLRLWQEATRVSPESYGAWNNLGVQIRRRDNDFERARAVFERALQCNPNAWEVVLNLATLHLDFGRKNHDPELLATAERYVQRSLELEPSSDRSRWTLAEVWLAMGREKEARGAFDQLASESGYFYEQTRYVYARVALDKGELTEAARYYRQALDAGCDPLAARLGLAEVARRAGRPRDALREARAAAEARPQDPQPFVFLAKMARGGQAAAYLFQAEKRGYRPTESERREILGSP